MKKKHLGSKEIANSLIILFAISLAIAALVFRDFGTFSLFLTGFLFGLAIER